MDWEALTPCDEIGAADWIRARLHPFAQDVGSVVPSGFDAYARIFHPAWRHADSKEIEVRWSDVAAWSGRTVHPEMQFHAIAVPSPSRKRGPKPWSGEPRMGVLSDRQTRALIGLLSNHTSRPDACWFCIWEGYGYFNPGAVKQMRSIWGRMRHARYLWWRLQAAFPKPKPKPRLRSLVELPHRNYVLFKASLADWRGTGTWGGPNLWWPDDRSWCVASEIDLPYTYIGGPSSLIDEVLVNPALEALPAKLEERITADSDTVNS